MDLLQEYDDASGSEPTTDTNASGDRASDADAAALRAWTDALQRVATDRRALADLHTLARANPHLIASACTGV